MGRYGPGKICSVIRIGHVAHVSGLRVSGLRLVKAQRNLFYDWYFVSCTCKSQYRLSEHVSMIVSNVLQMMGVYY